MTDPAYHSSTNACIGAVELISRKNGLLIGMHAMRNINVSVV